MGERNTENLVRTFLYEKGYVDDIYIHVEEQSSTNNRINDLLKKASKSKTGKKGYPEFIISSSKDTSFIIIIECKADISKHECPNIRQYENYAKDYADAGVLWYASFLKEEYKVIAIAISGETIKECKTTAFTWDKQALTYSNISDKIFLPYHDYKQLFIQYIDILSP